MNKKVFDNNRVKIEGKMSSNFTFSHEVFGEGFYNCEVEVKRLSDSYDKIPVLVSERLVDINKDYKEMYISVSGQYRSFNCNEDNRNKLKLSVFARDIEIMNELTETDMSNTVSLDGFLCKPPIYRVTPLGREIAELLLAVNRPYGKSDYIPCICWGRNAKYVEHFAAGDRISVHGRIQSREYQKKVNEDNFETRVAYEISVNKLERKED